MFVFCSLFADQSKKNPSQHYSLSVWRKHHREVKFEEQKVKLRDWLSPLIGLEKRPHIVGDNRKEGIEEESQETKSKNVLEFSFLLLKGVYRVHIQSCDTTNDTLNDISTDDVTTDDSFDCDSSTEVVSQAVNVDETSQIFDEETWCFGPHAEEHGVKKPRPQLEVTSLSGFESLKLFTIITISLLSNIS